MTHTTQHVTPRYRAPSRASREHGSITPTTITAMLGITVIAAVAILSFIYLGQVQDTAAQGSDIHRLEERILELRERQRALELESAELRSIQAIERRVPALNLVPADQVTYLEPLPDRVAARSP